MISQRRQRYVARTPAGAETFANALRAAPDMNRDVVVTADANNPDRVTVWWTEDSTD